MKYTSNIFVRFGGLSIKKQDGYSPNPKTTHSPPARRGIYAFPIKTIELFLIGGKHQGFSFEQLRARGAKVFKYDGPIWHHFGHRLKPNEILERKNWWVKSEFIFWEKAFKKESLNLRYGNDKNFPTKTINEPGRAGVSGFYSKDDFEIFIENKIGDKPIKTTQQQTKYKKSRYLVISFNGSTKYDLFKRGFQNLDRAKKYKDSLNKKYLNADFFIEDILSGKTIK